MREKHVECITVCFYVMCYAVLLCITSCIWCIFMLFTEIVIFAIRPLIISIISSAPFCSFARIPTCLFCSVPFHFKSKVKRILPRNANKHFIGSKLWFDIFPLCSITKSLSLSRSPCSECPLTIAWLFHFYLLLLELFRLPLWSRNV